MGDILFPERRDKPLRTNPQSLVLYGNYKVGKTTAVAALPDTLILELQPGGADFVPAAWVMQIPTADALISTLDALKAKREAKAPVARRIVLDHIGYLDDWLFDLALADFFKTPIGRGWKTKDGGLKRITDLPSAGSSGGSPGWAWYWEQLSIMHSRILAAAEEVIYLGHVRDRAVTKEAGDVVTQDIDLTGSRARRLFCGQSSAIGFCYRRRVGTRDEMVVNFKTSEIVLCGSSCPHLSGKEFVVGVSENGAPPTFDWKGIYPA